MKTNQQPHAFDADINEAIDISNRLANKFGAHIEHCFSESYFSRIKWELENGKRQPLLKHSNEIAKKVVEFFNTTFGKGYKVKFSDILFACDESSLTCLSRIDTSTYEPVATFAGLVADLANHYGSAKFQKVGNQSVAEFKVQVEGFELGTIFVIKVLDLLFVRIKNAPPEEVKVVVETEVKVVEESKEEITDNHTAIFSTDDKGVREGTAERKITDRPIKVSKLYTSV